ncbi:glycosyltransferase [Janthinobacterium aquaticum]|uniref:glycosyltransferase n=1 Tax=Janthinobacterium sp. FT58W TaxID=2654254 RepID=UPI001264EC35|nr:glycosyltransferase [Janthinobacterium sp. FT58W]KAB8043346.1 glycosyltransferase family 2 protein [Janthinobacterium sp. FT58W]
MSSKRFSISIVSHGHHAYIVPLLYQLASLKHRDFEVILTLNVAEDMPIDLKSLPFKTYLIVNQNPKGFAANHNAAFRLSVGNYFVVLNPDIRLIEDPFPSLLAMVEQASDSICAPLIIGNNGEIEDSARNFPSPLLLLRKLARRLFKLPLPREVVPKKGDFLMPDWAAGMFLVVPRNIYAKLNGFSERYFLYFEDVDLCARARLAGFRILVNMDIHVIHEAQRDSHRKLQFLVWHLESAMKFFVSGVYLKIQFDRLAGKK